MAAVPLEIEAQVRGVDPADPLRVSTVRGQHSLAKTPGEVLSVRLLPHDPPAVPDAVAAIDEADWAVLGPGSWFTSVLPHLMVPELAQALLRTDAKRLLVLNLVPQIGETDGFTPADHVEVLAAHAPSLRLDAILVDPCSLRGPHEARKLDEVAAAMGAVVHTAAVAANGTGSYHDPARLAVAIADIVERADASEGMAASASANAGAGTDKGKSTAERKASLSDDDGFSETAPAATRDAESFRVAVVVLRCRRGHRSCGAGLLHRASSCRRRARRSCHLDPSRGGGSGAPFTRWRGENPVNDPSGGHPCR
jgi:hypothetical protein